MNQASEALRRGDLAPDFDLPGTDGRRRRLGDVAGPRGLVVMFICNHCPYVLGCIDRIVHEVHALREIGIGAVAINSNDATAYPEDAFEPMVAFARRHGFDFPYLHDEAQTVARAYGAACTPEFFGLDRDRVLRYRGRLDAAGRGSGGPGTKRELFDAMHSLAQGGSAPQAQQASIGCSIKWKRR